MIISSCATAIDVLIIGQARSTQARCSVLTHFHICPLLDLPLLHLLRLYARWPTFLPGRVLPSSNAHALSYPGTQTSFTTGHNRVVSQSLKGLLANHAIFATFATLSSKQVFFCLSLRDDACLYKYVLSF